MSERRFGSGLLSRLAAPLAKAARRVVRRPRRDENEVRRLMDAALASAAQGQARLTDDTFRMFAEQLAAEENGAFQVKLHVVSLVEFHEAVGDKWARLSEKVMLIAEGVINMHLGQGNVFSRQGSDLFILLFRTCDNAEARRRAALIAQELGTRLVGDQFIKSEMPLALAAEVSLEDGLNEDGSINMAAVDAAVGDRRVALAAEAPQALGPRAWMRAGPPPGPAAAPDDRPPIELPPDAEAKPLEEPGWKKLQADARPHDEPSWKTLEVARAAKAQPQWVELETTPRKPAPDLEPPSEAGPAPLPPGARLGVMWRPSWMAAGETIGAYEARIQRTDRADTPMLEGSAAYAAGDLAGIHALDRFRIAAASRDFTASEAAGNTSTVIVPLHWLTLTAERHMEMLAPFADIPRAARGARVTIELFGVPADVKPMVLGSAIARARDLCRGVLLRSRLTDPRAAMALDCGAAMIGVDLADLAGADRIGEDDLLAALKGFHAQAAKARLGTYVWGVRRRAILVGAVQTGFGILNGPALMKDIPKPARQLPAPKSRFTLT